MTVSCVFIMERLALMIYSFVLCIGVCIVLLQLFVAWDLSIWVCVLYVHQKLRALPPTWAAGGPKEPGPFFVLSPWLIVGKAGTWYMWALSWLLFNHMHLEKQLFKGANKRLSWSFLNFAYWGCWSFCQCFHLTLPLEMRSRFSAGDSM